MWPKPPEPRLRGPALVAEAAGTALLVLAVMATASVSLAVLVAPWVGLLAASPLGRLSGAHLNPAVTLGFWAFGRMSRAEAAGYVAAQLAGAVAGAMAARLAALPGAVTHPTVPVAQAVGLEAAMTMLLVLQILVFVSSDRLKRWTPLAIVPVLAAIIWLGSPPTGASINPARSAGPALAFGDLADLWIYLLAPAAAGAGAGLALRRAVTLRRAPATTPATS